MSHIARLERLSNPYETSSDPKEDEPGALVQAAPVAQGASSMIRVLADGLSLPENRWA